jgi:hypothetical protein
VTCKWKAYELDCKTVEFKLQRQGNALSGTGRFSAVDLGGGLMQIEVVAPIDKNDDAIIKLTQPEADRIVSHTGRYRFRLQP